MIHKIKGKEINEQMMSPAEVLIAILGALGFLDNEEGDDDDDEEEEEGDEEDDDDPSNTQLKYTGPTPDQDGGNPQSGGPQ